MKILRPITLATLLGISLPTLWRMEKRGELPPRIKLSARAIGWREKDIDEWLEDRKESPNVQK